MGIVKLIQINSNGFSIVIRDNEVLHSVKNISNSIWSVGNGKSLNVDLVKNEINDFERYIILKSRDLHENINLFIKIDQNNNKNFCLFNTKNNETVWEIPFSSTIFLNTFEKIFILIFGDRLEKNKVACFSLNSDSQLWEYDVKLIGKYFSFLNEKEELGEVKKFIGVYKKQLIVLLTGGKFISLDVENGYLNWETNEVNENLTNQAIDYGFSDPYNPFLDDEKGIVYMLQGEVLISLNLNTQKSLYEWHIKDETNEEYIFIRQSRMYKNLIYFTAWKKGNEGNDDTIGIFDIYTKKIIWKYTFDFEKGNFIPNSQDNIQVNDSQLFVLDWKGTLHIFERES